MDPDRTIRAPATITKPATKLNVYTGPLVQSRFKLLGSAPSRIASISPAPQQNAAPSLIATSNSCTKSVNYQQQPNSVTSTAPASQLERNVTTRSGLPAPKSSGIARPTPLSQLISANSTTSSLRQPVQRPKSALQSKNSCISSSSSAGSSKTLSTLKPIVQIQSSASINNNKALNSISGNNKNTAQKIKKTVIKTTDIVGNAVENTITTTTTTIDPKVLIDTSVYNSVTGDVEAIRRLLEQLLRLLQDSHWNAELLSEENEKLKRENISLKRELDQLKHSPSETPTICNNGEQCPDASKNEDSLEEDPTILHSRKNPNSTDSNLFFSPML